MNDKAKTFIISIAIDIFLIVFIVPIIMFIFGVLSGDLGGIFGELAWAYNDIQQEGFTAFFSFLTLLWLAVTIGRIMGLADPIWPSLLMLILFFLLTMICVL